MFRSSTKFIQINDLQVQDMDHKVFKILADDFGGAKQASDYSIRNICKAVMNEKNKSIKSKLKSIVSDMFSFSAPGR